MDEAAIILEYFMQIQTSGVMLDVGAHHGKTALPFLETGWDVYAFEPDPENYKVLVEALASYETFYADSRAVADKTFESVPFYTSPISSGISSLCSFHKTHRLSYQIRTVCLSQFCREMNIQDIDLLKIDTEGFDLFVLKGIDWKNCRPKVIICEFEDAKTNTLSYSLVDIARYLAAHSYSLIISEWYPITHYGSQHSWRCFHQWPCQLHDNRAWGNILAFSEEVDLLAFSNAIGSFAEAKVKKLSQIPPSFPQQALSKGIQEISQIADNHLRRCWTELLKYKKIYSVFLVGMGSKTKRLLQLTDGIPGPEIHGIIEETAKDKQTLNGIPVIAFERLNYQAVDALVLPINLFQNKSYSDFLKNTKNDIPIVDLYEEFPKNHYLRLMRDMYVAAKNFKRAEPLAKHIMEAWGEYQDIEIYYQIGLEFHKEGNLTDAREIYEKVANDGRTDFHLASWALFKHGELLLEQGKKNVAQDYFSKALSKNPGHTKAAIFNTPLNRQLRVCLSTEDSFSQNSQKNCIPVPMDPLDETLWAYYFSCRRIDHASLKLSSGFQIKNITKLLLLIHKYLAPRRAAHIILNDNEAYQYCKKKIKEMSDFFEMQQEHDSKANELFIKKNDSQMLS